MKRGENHAPIESDPAAGLTARTRERVLWAAAIRAIIGQEYPLWRTGARTACSKVSAGAAPGNGRSGAGHPE
jgi:hypothetical protein